MPADPKKLKRRSNDLKAAKQLHEQVWKDCYDLSLPARANGLLSEIITATDAQQRKAIIYDSTAPDSVRVGVATIMGGMVPSNAQWFYLDIGKEIRTPHRLTLRPIERACSGMQSPRNCPNSRREPACWT